MFGKELGPGVKCKYPVTKLRGSGDLILEIRDKTCTSKLGGLEVVNLMNLGTIWSTTQGKTDPARSCRSSKGRGRQPEW